MGWLAPSLLTAFLAIVFPLRGLLQRRRGWRGAPLDWLAPRPRAWRVADVAFAAGFATLLIGASLAALGEAGGRAPGPAQVVVGVVLTLAAASLSRWAQATMGAAWRTDIAPVEAGSLVTGGPFRVVRNPNYLAMLSAGVGVVVLAPIPLTIVGLAVLWGSLLLTARLEEPPLLLAYGERYGHYAAGVGRFLPRIGRLRS